MIICFLSSFLLFMQKDLNPTEVRELFFKAEKSRGATIALKDKLKNINESQPLLLGYKAMAEMLLAKHAFNPINKLRHFNNGKELLKQAIVRSKEEGAIELRYLRFTVQTNAPGFLGYNENIAEDKAGVIRYLIDSEKDSNIDHKMRVFLLESPHVSEEEKKMLSN